MIQVKRQHSFSKVIALAAVFIIALSSSLFAQDPPVADAAVGKSLFNANCAACHKLYKDMTGPQLHGVTEKYDREWLYKWIKNSQGLVASGDSQAVSVFEANGKKLMNSFPALVNADIDNILAYTDTPLPTPVDVVGGGSESRVSDGGVSNNIILAILGFILLLLVAILFLVNNTLKKFAEQQGLEVEESEKRTPIWKAFVENQFLVMVSVIFLLLGGAYFAYGWMSQIGVDQGYMPVQPIHYSHKIHAGDNAIECKYCHSSARVSKTSGIPSLNVCMNCHKTISEVAGAESEFTSVSEDYSKEFYDGEIQKLYKAVGWDQTTQSYTGKTEAVEWVRIHNLPDFAYFNHSQHVSVAGVECQTCHGPVEEMEVMYQHAPLTMGWCINCHRETNVKVEGNEYYEEIHAQLAKKYGVDKVTAAQMGGLECGKCHY